MISLKTPNGLNVEVPETSIEDVSPKFTIEQKLEANSYYEKHGYVVFKGVIDKKICEKVRSIWDAEVKPSKKYIYRQATAKSELNVLNEKGWVMNPILNLQSLNPKYFGRLRESAVNDLLGAPNIQACFESLIGEKPKVVQSMYFEGNSATWEHQDTYYLDSEKLGDMSAAWVALEEISAKAGRFFICPGSHKIEIEKQNKDINVADNHSVYIQKIVDIMKERNMEIRAPLLEAGDVLFWHAWTMHGSLYSQDKTSRSSITMHAIPSSQRFCQLQTRVFEVPTDDVNGTKIWRPKDQAVIKNRLIMFVESYFPGPFYALKRFAIRMLFR
ncbi:MAG: phytanoyl-CoA hydroxylase [Arenicella sp.]|jgi:phytanoyl-CoA hydroxylase